MARDEKFTPASQIKKAYKNNVNSSGIPVYSEYGKTYYDNSERHIKIVGNSGSGKTQGIVLPLIRNIIDSKESAIITDMKGEICRNTMEYAKKQGYNTIVVDFRDPYHSPSRWNPLELICDSYFDGTFRGKDIAATGIADLASSIQPVEKDDPFWSQSSAELLTGLFHILLELAERDEINMASFCELMKNINNYDSNNSAMGRDNKILLRSVIERLPMDSNARGFLQTYINAPEATRNSIYSVASNSLRMFSQSEGLLQLLCNDTIDIKSLDIDDKPEIIYIIIPDETNAYDGLASLLISQLMNHFLRIADTKHNGRFPSTLWLVLEELGNVGSSISGLDKWMTGARSRNIRIALVLQSDSSQLEDVYGKAKAETINSTCGITVGFTTNSWSTLEEWSQRCGKVRIFEDGVTKEELLITPNQLASMPKGMALVMIGGRYKYITKFPMYYKKYGAPTSFVTKSDKDVVILPIEKFDFAGKAKKLISKFDI